MNRLLLTISILLLQSIAFHSRVQAQSDTVNVYSIYENQVMELLKVRGVPKEQIVGMLKTIKENNLNSDQGLANLLESLYSKERGIAMLFYFFNGDSLRRVLLEPGKVVATTTIRIQKDELLQLSVDLNHVLGLYKLSKNRAPRKRGVGEVTTPKSSGLKYDDVIAKASGILLPESFDTTYRHLLIIPALNIGTIPFHLLQPYGDKTTLINYCSFTIVPGLIDLFSLRMKALRNATQWMGIDLTKKFDENFAIKNLDEAAYTIDSALFISNPVYPSNTDYIFPDLPGAKKEVENAKKYASDYILLDGKKATRENVIKGLGHADVAYFATHGIADTGQPMEKSFLVLSGDQPFLTAKDIMDLRGEKKSFPVMVILSACQTGLGKSMEAGVAGLARSFLLAGSSHVIMSLWNVDDEATAFLMTRFIYHLRSPHRFMPSEPLRLALLDTRIEYPDPAKWASFSLFGIDY